MESNNIDMSITSNGTGPAGSRWNPTKEQIELLESLYKQGIRTPSAEQIQQITCKLRAFGHIEGKNVFYWFQNHKARQRQKQKQENITHLNRFLHRAPPPYPSWPPNVSCRPYYMPPSEQLAYHHPHYPRVFVPGCYKRIPTAPENSKSWNVAVRPDPRAYQEHKILMMSSSSGTNEEFISAKHFNQETLDLFPLHPTGNLQAQGAGSFSVVSSTYDGETSSAAASTSSDESHMIEKGNFGERHFIDFFCSNGPCD